MNWLPSDFVHTEISWWVVDEHAGSALVPAWIATAWPFEKPHYRD